MIEAWPFSIVLNYLARERPASTRKNRFMSSRQLGLLVLSLLVVLVAVPVVLDGPASPRDSRAQALDLFGDSGENGDPEESFWKDGSPEPSTAPAGVPDFATLAERASPAVVNVKASRTVASAMPLMP